MTETSLAIEVKNLTKSFSGAEKVLNDISVVFPAGKLTYILGPSGTGKSVLLKTILGLLPPDSGEVWIGGKEICSMRRRHLREFRKNFGVLFQNSALFDDLSVFENVAFPLWEHTDLSFSEVEKKVKDTLSHLGMNAGYDKLPNQLSGGMKKRVGLARAVILEPSILLYDEPTTGLDPVTRTTVDHLIETLKDEFKTTSLVISHDIPSALTLADHIVFLHGGKVAFEGTPQEFSKIREGAMGEFVDAERKVAKTLATL